MDASRFSIADHQLAAFSYFSGDGIISGLNLETDVFPNIKVTKGSALVDGFHVLLENDVLFESPFVEAPGVYYVYIKRIIDSIGETGTSSPILTARIDDITPPAIPVGFTIEPPNNTVSSSAMIVGLSWTANTDVDLDKYNLYRSVSGGSFALITSTTEISYQDEDVVEGTLYSYRLSAEDKSGNESGFATETITTPVSLSLPPDPRRFNVYISDTAVNLVWESPETIESTDLDSYLVSYNKLDTDGTVLERNSVSITKDKLSYRIGGLLNNAIYSIIIQTVDTRGRISEGLSKESVPQRDPAPFDPVLLRVTELGSESGPDSVNIRLNWSPGGDEYEAVSDVYYRVYFRLDGLQNNNESLYIETPVNQLELDVSAVPFPGKNIAIPEKTLVTVRITAVSKEGLESQGSFIRFKTGLYASTKALRNVTAVYNISSIVVNWTNNEDTENVKMTVTKTSPDDPYEEPIVVFEEYLGKVWIYSLLVPDLNSVYYFTVIPINKNGVEGPSTTVFKTTLTVDELGLPPLPSGLELKYQYGSMNVTWKSASSDIVSYYRVYRSEGRYSIDYSDYTLLDTIDKDIYSYIDYGLKDETSYTYYVTSVDIFGQESQHLSSGTTNVGMVSADTPLEGSLAAVDNATITENGFDVILSWDVIIGDAYDAFEILRSIGNLSSFESIATVNVVENQESFTYTDENILTESDINYNYIIRKISNNSSIELLTSDNQPDNSICLGNITLNANSYGAIDTSCIRNINNLYAPLIEMTDTFLLGHLHQGASQQVSKFIDGTWYRTLDVGCELIDLNPSLIVTDWTTTDGQLFSTEENITGGTIYTVKLDGLFPNVLYEVNSEEGQIVFAEKIVQINETTGDPLSSFNLELTVLGIEEATDVLQTSKFDYINAQQIGINKLENSQLPRLDHEGRIKERLVPKRTSLTRYDNHTFTTNGLEKQNKELLGEGTTFFAITDKASDLDSVSDFDETLVGNLQTFQNPYYIEETRNNILDSSTAAVSDEKSYSGSNSYKVEFRFIDTDDSRWMRLSTFGYNPTVDITKKFSVRLMVQSGSFYFGLGIRNSNVINPVIGNDGGILFSNGEEATVEFVGCSELRGTGSSVVPEGKYLVTAQPNVWQVFEFDIPNETILPYTGNGVLSTANNFATLEHFNFTINPDADIPTEEIVVYIDDLIQLTDTIVSGTSQGIRKSPDYGDSWDLVRYTATPVYKFYKAVNNEFLWGISPKEVYYSTDVDNWFEVPGIKSIQFVRDITEDSLGNMYISSDKGVYLLQTSAFSTFSEFRQTSPLNAFSTESYAIWRDLYPSEYGYGVYGATVYGGNAGSVIYVSTELGIYSTNDLGVTWEETLLQGSPIPLFRVIVTTLGWLAFSKQKVFRKLFSESQFLEIANLNEQVSIDEIWDTEYYNGNFYLSTNDGIYQNTTQNMFESGTPTTLFDRVFSSTDLNNSPMIGYSLNEIGERLWIGSENILYSANELNKVFVKKEFLNKERPSINVDGAQKDVGFVYGSFNGVVNFRESLTPTQSVSVDNLPRQIYLTEKGKWDHSNIESPLLISVNGEYKWIDFKLDESSVTSFVTNAKTAIENVQEELTIRNSYLSDATIARTIASADLILSGVSVTDVDGNTVSTGSVVNSRTVAEFLKNYSFTVSSINLNQVQTEFPDPSFVINGRNIAQREVQNTETFSSLSLTDLPYTSTLSNVISYSDFKKAFEGNYLESELMGRIKLFNLTVTSSENLAIQIILNILKAHRTIVSVEYEALIEDRENFVAENATGIVIDPASGIVDFTSFNDSTVFEERNKFSFSKNDKLDINIYYALIGDTGTLTHTQIEDSMEWINSGMPASLAANVHGNLIKTGIQIERNHNFAFDSFYAQKIQAQYYPATASDWYDQINSTVDYELIVESDSSEPASVVYDMHWFNEDPYFSQRLWVATDKNIFEYTITESGNISFVRIVSPTGSVSEVRSICVRNEDQIYVIANNSIYYSLDFGTSWVELDTNTLPEELYSLVIVNNNLIVGTSEGPWWNSGSFVEFTKSSLSFSPLLSTVETNTSEQAFVSTILNLHEANFSFIESKLDFFLSRTGTDFIGLGKITNNNVTSVSTLHYYKNLLWVATDKGLYNDSGTILSDKVAFGLQAVTGSPYDSSLLKINDIVSSKQASSSILEMLYCGDSTENVYQYMNRTWKTLETDLSSVHKMLLIEDFETNYLVLADSNQLSVLSVASFDDEENDVTTIEIEPCVE